MEEIKKDEPELALKRVTIKNRYSSNKVNSPEPNFQKLEMNIGGKVQKNFKRILATSQFLTSIRNTLRRGYQSRKVSGRNRQQSSINSSQYSSGINSYWQISKLLNSDVTTKKNISIGILYGIYFLIFAIAFVIFRLFFFGFLGELVQIYKLSQNFSWLNRSIGYNLVTTIELTLPAIVGSAPNYEQLFNNSQAQNLLIQQNLINIGTTIDVMNNFYKSLYTDSKQKHDFSQLFDLEDSDINYYDKNENGEVKVEFRTSLDQKLRYFPYKNLEIFGVLKNEKIDKEKKKRLLENKLTNLLNVSCNQIFKKMKHISKNIAFKINVQLLRRYNQFLQSLFAGVLVSVFCMFIAQTSMALLAGKRLAKHFELYTLLKRSDFRFMQLWYKKLFVIFQKHKFNENMLIRSYLDYNKNTENLRINKDNLSLKTQFRALRYDKYFPSVKFTFVVAVALLIFALIFLGYLIVFDYYFMLGYGIKKITTQFIAAQGQKQEFLFGAILISLFNKQVKLSGESLRPDSYSNVFTNYVHVLLDDEDLKRKFLEEDYQKYHNIIRENFCERDSIKNQANLLYVCKNFNNKIFSSNYITALYSEGTFLSREMAQGFSKNRKNVEGYDIDFIKENYFSKEFTEWRMANIFIEPDFIFQLSMIFLKKADELNHWMTTTLGAFMTLFSMILGLVLILLFYLGWRQMQKDFRIVVVIYNFLHPDVILTNAYILSRYKALYGNSMVSRI